MGGEPVIAVTFDIDDVAWHADRPCDELRDAVPALADLLAQWPGVCATWFVRLDAGIEHAHGRADALFVGHARLLERLRAAGHEIAWHHHAVTEGTAFTPCTDTQRICRELARLAPVARALELTSVRLGWAHSAPDIVARLDDLGFRVDSSAMPRPAYAWDRVPASWDGAPREPYHPAIGDHRRSGAHVHALLEVPLTVTAIPLPTDTVPGVERYLNVAYHPDHFAAALRQVQDAPVLVTVTHPYETTPHTGPRHPLLAHSCDAVARNLAALSATGRRFVTIGMLGA